MSAAEFQTIMTPLALATNRVLEDETWTVYHDGLRDVPTPTLQQAVGRLIASATFFPTVGEIRASCDRVTGQFQTFTVPALPVLEDDDPRLWHSCLICQDSGWASHWCRGSVNASPRYPDQFMSERPCGSSACQRFLSKGYGHEFVMRCQCYATNPTILKRLAERKTYGDKP